MIRAFLAKQLGQPSGFFGRLLMRLLNLGNASMNDFTFQQLDLQSSDAVLEIGFGGGYLLEKIIASQIPNSVAGIDLLKQTRSRWASKNLIRRSLKKI